MLVLVGFMVPGVLNHGMRVKRAFGAHRAPASHFCRGAAGRHGFECIEMTDAEVQKPAAAEPSPAAHNVLL